MSAPFDPITLDEDAFLAGPDRYAEWDGESDLIDVDPIFGKSFSRIWAEQINENADSVIPSTDASITPSVMHDGYRFRDVPAGLLLETADGNPVGGYLGCDVAIDEGHQGQGLGAELILEYAMRNGRIPVWDHSTAAFSPAGEQAHRSAHALARHRKLFEAKRDAILGQRADKLVEQPQ